METLAPPLNAIIEIQLNLKNGMSVKTAIDCYLHEFEDEFSIELRSWYIQRSKGANVQSIGKTIYRRHLVELLNRGLKGEPILEALVSLQEDMIEIAKEDMEAQLQKLPTLMLIPLLFFQFPAFMLVLLGPIALNLLSSLELV